MRMTKGAGKTAQIDLGSGVHCSGTNNIHPPLLLLSSVYGSGHVPINSQVFQESWLEDSGFPEFRNISTGISVKTWEFPGKIQTSL